MSASSPAPGSAVASDHQSSANGNAASGQGGAGNSDGDADAEPAFAVRSIAIIGAGPSGLTAAKHLLSLRGSGSGSRPGAVEADADSFAGRIDVFEQQAEVGGVWNYSAETRPLPRGGGDGNQDGDGDGDPPRVPFTYADHVALGYPAEKPLFPAGGASVNGQEERGGDRERKTEERVAPLFPGPMYEDLHTNIPHTLMRFSDLAFTEDDAQIDSAEEGGEKKDTQRLTIFPRREAVQRYLIRYACEVRHLIRFSTQVVDVAPVPASTSANANANASAARERWAVTTRDLLATGANARATTTSIYDAVVVASGHYATPHVPAINGLAAFAAAHPGAVAHSKTYRTAGAAGSDYAGKKVVLVGNSASGLDIASQVRAVCRSPLLLSVRTPTPEEALRHLNEGTKAAVVEVPEMKRFLTEGEGRGVEFADGRIETDVDAVLFCTGYLYTFPFLRNLSDTNPAIPATPNGNTKDDTAHNSNTTKDSLHLHPNRQAQTQIGTITDGRRVHPLAYHLLHARHPTLAFPGLPYKAIPFPVAEAQMAMVARLWANLLPPRPPPTSPTPTPLPTSSPPAWTSLIAWLGQQAEREEAEWRGRSTDPATGTGEQTGFHMFPRGGDGRYINAMHEWATQAGAGIGRAPPRWDPEALWQRSVYAEAKMAFEKAGRTATTLAEIGFRFDEGQQQK